jgi:hypothetical protein
MDGDRSATPRGEPARDRRRFFRDLCAEVICLVHEAFGRQQLRLGDLDRLPEETLRKLVPVLDRKRAPVVARRQLLARNARTGSLEPLCAVDEVEEAALGCFDGSTTVEEIGRRIAVRFGLDEPASYQRVRSLFLSLAKRSVCLPSRAHD